MAGTALTSGTAVGTSATSLSIKNIVTTSMSVSKGFLVGTALIAIVCVPIGYKMHNGADASITQVQPQSAKVLSIKPKKQPDHEESVLFAEWRALHEKYGTNAQAMPKLFKAIADMKDSFHREALNGALIAEWAQVDPAGDLHFSCVRDTTTANARTSSNRGLHWSHRPQ